MTEPAQRARIVIQQLLSGHAPDNADGDDYGDWAEVVAALVEAQASGGTAAVRRTFDVLARAHRPLLALVAGGLPTTPRVQLRAACPPLLSEATAVHDTANSCGQWLDDYVAFAAAAFPMTPRSFHEAAGLFAASLAVARRMCLRVATSRIFPNLYLLYIAPSGARRKSTAMGGLQQLLETADLTHLLLPQRVTPEALIERMSVGRVRALPSAARRAQWLREQAFAGQRGWLRDEVSALFSSMRRDFNAELLELVLELYDCKERAGESATVTRGDDLIERSYLSLFGAANPDTMAPHLANRSHWLNGLWARFALIAPGLDEPHTWQFYREPMAVPSAITTGLRRIYTLFPEPQAQIVEPDADSGLSQPFVELSNVEPPSGVAIELDAWTAWEAYSKATGWTMTLPDSPADLPPELHASYARLGTQLIKVAMLLAAMDAETAADIQITLAHIARAQTIVERWRGCLHRLWAEQSGSDDSRLMTRILRYLQRSGPSGMTCRDLCHSLGSKARETGEALEVLMRAGRVGVVETVATNGRRVELWIASEQTNSVE
jgi:hypothetical protein